MTESQSIVAYRDKGKWYKASDVQKDRKADRGKFVEALPYTVTALRRRRQYGGDVPEWVNLDEAK